MKSNHSFDALFCAYDLNKLISVNVIIAKPVAKRHQSYVQGGPKKKGNSLLAAIFKYFLEVINLSV